MSELSATPKIQLNTRGLRCPDPILMLRQAIRKSDSGDIIEVYATDPSTSWDIPRFCTYMNHELLLQEEIVGAENLKEYRYWVKKG